MRVLFLGCHCDDIELGCGGTIYKHKQDWDITCVCFSQCGPFNTLRSLKKHSTNALGVLGVNKTEYLNYPTNDFWMHRQSIWQDLNRIESYINPELVITQVPDEHQDHVVLHEETIRNFKNANILCYKPSLSYGMSHCWNWIEKIELSHLEKKIEATRFFKEYLEKSYFSPENIKSQARVMGLNPNVEFAEAFQVYRIVKL